MNEPAKVKNSHYFGSYVNQFLYSSSILDVFVLQGILDFSDSEKLKRNLRTNREIENFLIRNRLVSRETINKAYSIILKIPFIKLKNIEINERILSMVPEKIARKFNFVPFDVSNNLIKIAITRPADLLASYPEGLLKLFNKKDLIVEIFITGEEDFVDAISQYSKKGSGFRLKKGSLPVVYLRNRTLLKEYLQKLPKDFISKYRLVIFDKSPNDAYQMACERYDSATSKKILDYIREQNQIELEVFTASKEDIDFALSVYETGSSQPKDLFFPEEQKSAQEAPETVVKKSALKNAFHRAVLNILESNTPKLTIDSVSDDAYEESKLKSVGLSGQDDLLSETSLKDEDIHDDKLAMLPFDFMKENNLAVFNQSENGELMIASDTPESPVTKKAIEYIQKQYPVRIYAVTNENFEKALKQREKIKDDPNAKKIPLEDFNELTISSLEKEKKGDNKGWFGPGTAASGGKKNKSKEKTIDAVSAEAPDENEEKPTRLETSDIGSLLQQDIVSVEDMIGIIKEGYVPKIVAAVINYSLNKRASDIHIEPQGKSLRIRCRIDGVLTDIAKSPLSLHPPIVSRIKILSKLKIDETRIPQDGRFDVAFNDREVDVRVSTLPTVHGEKVVMRILDKTSKVLSFEDLGLLGSGFDKTIESIKKPWGIILVTGPTGSGKSTTLNAVIARINQPGINIVTLEDPVEYETPGVNQCQIKPDIGFTFATGLRSVLRQDPNIIMVGEIRDAETAGMVTHAALTGHLVLTTLHTNDTAGCLPRLINMGVEPFLITSSVDLVIAQRLIRVICPKCKEEIKLPPKVIEDIKNELAKIPTTNTKDRARIPKEMRFYYGKGCSECSQGYKGRIGIFEVMRMTSKIEDLAVARRPASEILKASIEDGMITIKQDGILKALAGVTTIDEVFQAAMNN